MVNIISQVGQFFGDIPSIINTPPAWLVPVVVVICSCFSDYINNLKDERDNFGFTFWGAEFFKYEAAYAIVSAVLIIAAQAALKPILGRNVTLIEAVLFSPSLSDLIRQVAGKGATGSRPMLKALSNILVELRADLTQASEIRRNKILTSHIEGLNNVTVTAAMKDDLILTITRGRTRTPKAMQDLVDKIQNGQASNRELVSVLMDSTGKQKYFNSEFHRIFKLLP